MKVMFDGRFKVADTLLVTGKPTGVALGIKIADILVCMNQQEIVQYSMRMGSELFKENKLSVSNPVWSVAAFDNVMIVGGNNCISRISLGDKK